MASTVSTLLAPVYNYVLIFSCGYGLHGAAFANDAIFLTTALLLGGWTIWYDHAVEGRPEDTWQGWCVNISQMCLGIRQHPETHLHKSTWWGAALARPGRVCASDQCSGLGYLR